MADASGYDRRVGTIAELRAFAREQLAGQPWADLLSSAHPFIEAQRAYLAILDAYAAALPHLSVRWSDDGDAEVGAFHGDLARLWRALPRSAQEQVRRRRSRRSAGRTVERRALLWTYLDRPGIGWWRDRPTTRELACLDILDATDEELAELARLQFRVAIAKVANWARLHRRSVGNRTD